ncbi:TetR/AcrR family transcriptional regulator [Clostridium sp. YIM B02515]|uniref:TetR/AcrR family transcriptional regulator n=1 Tax=Clostridium rhizosphaerae TaxID=2803861 RepID=A0ABS1TD22_9CLOT|nr:TetR/AcrR family transcriptional regulator [Clostridium rhizosphaerae]MBL4937259.1 TetR/AcrR family transcriptional regulator [Clostridium rhizosphaerae]
MSRIIENPKELILEKAKEILCNQGYSHLSMRTLAKECDIALGTIYNYYPTKKELVLEMMTGYWKEYFKLLQVIIASDDNLYVKLEKIFNELNLFIKQFKEIWLKPELYDKPDYVESGIERENIYIDKFIRVIESMLVKEASDDKITLKLDSYETAKFILLNFITMIQMPIFNYSSFEVFLRNILK